jgi:hypothetical protein
MVIVYASWFHIIFVFKILCHFYCLFVFDLSSNIEGIYIYPYGKWSFIIILEWNVRCWLIVIKLAIFLSNNEYVWGKLSVCPGLYSSIYVLFNACTCSTSSFESGCGSRIGIKLQKHTGTIPQSFMFSSFLLSSRFWKMF